VRLVVNDGVCGEFPYVWLRDNCQCPECRHPQAAERTLDTVSLNGDLRPTRVDADGGLALVWADGHRTNLSAEWLRVHMPGWRSRAAQRSEPVLWTGRSVSDALPEIDFDELDGGDEGLLRWLRLIRDYGFAFVRGVPTHSGAVVRLAERIAFLQETNFGRTFRVQSKPDPENLAYTAVKLAAHTDVPNRRGVPGLQFLHCIAFGARGGGSILVDGYLAATRLREQDPSAHDLLASVEIPFRFQDTDHDIVNRFPVIGVDGDGHYTEIRYNPAVMAPLDIDTELIRSYYAALRAFGQLLRDPQLELVFKMQPGDCQVFDNRRVLHGREAFDPSSGPRHLEGCYVDWDDFMSRLRVLERRRERLPSG
jgi:gamma-butyrobetaine dioxygenase